MDFFYRGPDKSTALDRLQQARLIAVDLESVSLNDLTAIGIGAQWSDTESAYFPIFPQQADGLSVVMGKVTDNQTTKIYHNGMGFDLEVLDLLTEEGWPAPDDTNIEDTSIMSQCSGLPAALERLGVECLGATDLFSIQSLFQEFQCRDMLGVPIERTATKCLNDCRTTWKLFHSLNGQSRAGVDNGQIRPLTTKQRDCYEVDRRLIHVLRVMQRKGLGLRQGILGEYKARLERSICELECDLQSEGIDKPGSNIQCGLVLASRGNFLPRTQNGRGKQLRVDEDALEELDDPLAKTLLDWRKQTKLLSTYVNPWIGKSRAYTHFRLDLATGRLASGAVNKWDSINRNLQNIPPGMREVFEPDNGLWSWADHGQIELRVLAYLSRDRAMLEEYSKPKPDLHQLTATAGGISRQDGKTFNFARVFGAGDKKLSKSTGVPLQQVPMVKAAMADLFPESSRWIQKQMLEHGEWVETAFGRRCRLPEPQPGAEYNPRYFASHVAKCAVNYPVQGTAADIVKRNMLKLHDWGADMRLQIHDEFLVDGDYDFPEELAHTHPELPTPFEVKKGLVWS